MNTTEVMTLAERRAARLAMVMDGYEAQDAPDGSVPGAARVGRTAQRFPRDPEAGKLVKHPRYALVTQYDGNYRMYLAEDRAGVEKLAAHLVTDAYGAEFIWCYFDLDELAGEEELPHQVLYQGAVWDVVSRTCEGGVPTGKWTLRKYPSDRRRTSYDWATVDPSEVDVEGWEDERMPVRYGVAKVVVQVIFNTVPSP